MRFFATLTTILFALSIPGYALAEEAPSGAASAKEAQQPVAEDASSEAAPSEDASPDDSDDAQLPLLDEAQLDQLVAPIALYPDALLSQVLIAATYPLEVVQAERWKEKNKDLKDDALEAAAAKQDWDDSIKALAAVPDVLAMMSKDLDWTAKLGDAVLAQQGNVMEAIQRLRALAQTNGMLKSNEQQTVTVTDEPPAETAAVKSAGAQTVTVAEQPPAQQVIVIEQTSPEIVYVPYYNPSVVYGVWPYPTYAPYYFPPPIGYGFGGALARGVAWSAGFAIGNAIWGNGFNWRNNDIRVNVNRNVNINNRNVNVNASNWQHNSYHRRGVSYNNTNVQNKFSKGGAADKRADFRGRGDGLAAKKPDLGGKRPGAGLGDKRPGVGDKRPGAGLGDKRPSVGDKRPGAGAKRPSTGLADRKPNAGAKRPNVGDMEAALKKKPDVSKRPNAKRPSGNAFNARDGAKAKDFSNRGKASLGNRSSTKAARPATRPKPAAQRPKSRPKPAAQRPKSRPKPSVQRPKSRPSAKRPSVSRPSGGRGGGGRGRGGGGGRRR